MSSKPHLLSLLALLSLPVSSTDGWKTFPFDKTRTNEISFSARGLSIHVDHSTSFSLYPLPGPSPVRHLHVEGEALALPRLHHDVPEGTGHDDDFALRVGLVFSGKQRLSWWSRQFAPKWLNEISELAPQGGGISRIHYYELAQTLPVGTRRTISEKWQLSATVAASNPRPGRFVFDLPVKESEPALAVWVQADGDDTGSAFDVRVNKIDLERAGR